MAAASQGRWRTHQCCIVTHVRSMLLVLLRARVYISASRICRNVSCRLEAESERTWTYGEAKSGAKRSGATRRGATLSLSIIFPRYRTVVEAAVASDRLRTISATPDCASAFFLYLWIIMHPVSRSVSEVRWWYTYKFLHYLWELRVWKNLYCLRSVTFHYTLRFILIK